jgi:hypothetical protein
VILVLRWLNPCFICSEILSADHCHRACTSGR